MDIDTGNSPPIAQAPYKVPLRYEEWLRDELDRLEKAGIIEQCMSPWASPVVIVPKKQIPGEPVELRMCVDYKGLNSLLPTTLNPSTSAQGALTMFPLPRIDELLASLKGAKCFSSLDCTSGYYHIALSEDAQQKSAFVTKFGKHKFKRVPFGLTQAPAYFQHLMNRVVGPIPNAFAYIDDILVFSKTEEEHLKDIRSVFEALKKADLRLKKVKCDFFMQELEYLGHIITHKGIHPIPEKLEAIQNMKPPTNPKQARQLLGLTGFYRKFVPHYATLVRPLTVLTKSTIPFKMEETALKAFNMLKEAMQKPPILVYPDPTQPYVLYTDASKYGWGAVLMQERAVTPPDIPRKRGPDVVQPVESMLHPIAYVSGQLKGAQLLWPAMVKEAFALFRAVKRLDHYLRLAVITWRCDHLPLKKFLLASTACDKVNNWAIELEPYNITFEYIKGTKNLLADTLSRLVDNEVSEALPPEPYGFEYGKYIFEETPEVKATREKKEKARRKAELIETKIQAIQTEPVPEDLKIKLQSLDPPKAEPPLE